MEKIIREHITKYLEKTSCISNNQHGFMSKKGCTSNLLESVDYITKSLSKRNVLSEVPQVFVLDPTLFIIYINNLTDNLKSVYKIHADDIKMLLEIRPEFHDAGCLILQKSLIIVSEWSKEWLMKLNVAKCKVMHLDHGNINHEYVMNDGNTSLIIAATDIERDLGIFTSNDLKWNQHIQVATRRENMILGLI
ncbi:uncharacterized protein LOC124809470 [Hydra vulgaris]|uniref:uncharacterized protein LOC124809470 n=1 Tax=Hydra vulgaris TaxID=6087 RepID=UPI001F5F80E9|nr:uncharacterized protein LOC124809470 [Hydra vulgaris]